MGKRTPRNYSGTENPLKKASDLLPGMLSKLRCKASDSKEDLFRFWFDLIGERYAHLTEPASFFDGILTVKVKSSTLYSLLVAHEKLRLLQRLQEKFSVRDLVFRVG